MLMKKSKLWVAVLITLFVIFSYNFVFAGQITSSDIPSWAQTIIYADAYTVLNQENVKNTIMTMPDYQDMEEFLGALDMNIFTSFDTFLIVFGDIDPSSNDEPAFFIKVEGTFKKSDIMNVILEEAQPEVENIHGMTLLRELENQVHMLIPGDDVLYVCSELALDDTIDHAVGDFRSLSSQSDLGKAIGQVSDKPVWVLFNFYPSLKEEIAREMEYESEPLAHSIWDNAQTIQFFAFTLDMESDVEIVGAGVLEEASSATALKEDLQELKAIILEQLKKEQQFMFIPLVNKIQIGSSGTAVNVIMTMTANELQSMLQMFFMFM